MALVTCYYGLTRQLWTTLVDRSGNPVNLANKTVTVTAHEPKMGGAAIYTHAATVEDAQNGVVSVTLTAQDFGPSRLQLGDYYLYWDVSGGGGRYPEDQYDTLRVEPF